MFGHSYKTYIENIKTLGATQYCGRAYPLKMAEEPMMSTPVSP